MVTVRRYGQQDWFVTTIRMFRAFTDFIPAATEKKKKLTSAEMRKVKFPGPRSKRLQFTDTFYRRRRSVWPAASVVRRSSPTRTTKCIAPEKSSFVLHDCYGACIPGLEFAYDNEGSSGHGWRLDSKICEVFALTARALCGSIIADRNRFPQYFTITSFVVRDASAHRLSMLYWYSVSNLPSLRP